MKKQNSLLVYLFSILLFIQCSPSEPPLTSLKKDAHIALIGNNLCSRMMNYGHFETELHLRFPDSMLYIRNMCDGGNTTGFRPHPGREKPWAFEGAASFQEELANPSHSEGHFAYPDEWLSRLKTDIVLGFFGYNESFAGEAGLEMFKGELTAFIKHTKAQQYNGSTAPTLVLVSPIAFQDLSGQQDLPDGKIENTNLQLYTEAMEVVAAEQKVGFVDAFTPSQAWFTEGERLTIDGAQLNEAGYERLSKLLADKIFGAKKSATQHKELVKAAVQEKNWIWHNDFKIPNGVHIYGRRYDPFGPDNYPAELTKIREMTDIRDQVIWEAVKGKTLDITALDKKTTSLPAIETNYKGEKKYLYDKEVLDAFTLPEGYKIELFASEKEFPDLANPVQMSFDDKGRLWVAVMPSYPHYRPGDEKPNDKLLILEDTNKDGKADKQTVFADGLSLPIGFEFAPEGVYVSQAPNLVLLKDTDGDDKADTKEILLSGFDDHDTHHAISAFCADPSGAIYMGEGVFLHTNVETAYGPIRATNGGFFRYNPQRHHLERTAQLSIPNPWGIAFDEWGQNFFAETSGPDVRWMMPGSTKPVYGKGNHKSPSLIEAEHKVRPTSGIEFVSSRHFPDEMQGDLLINNTIGFLGTKQHRMSDDTTGYLSHFRQDLVRSTDKNYRPVDLEFAPDGSLYIVDWHNVLVGHMQHNARDPLRDHVHGRIYRITYPARPLVEPAQIAGASIETLLDNLKLPEYRSRYRSRRALRGHDATQVLAATSKWIENLDRKTEDYEHHLLEALWVTWGLNKMDVQLLQSVLNAKNFRARTAAVRVLRYMGHQVGNQSSLLLQAARDEHPRVRLEAMVAATWLEKDIANTIIEEVGKKPMGTWMQPVYETALLHLNGGEAARIEPTKPDTDLEGRELALFQLGKEVYLRDAHCGTCHQLDGKGLTASQYPPLTATKWVTENEARLIKLTLKGLYGPMRVKHIPYAGDVPMTAFEKLLTDEEIAGVLTYIRNSFGNTASAISPELVAQVRAEVKDRKGAYKVEELE